MDPFPSIFKELFPQLVLITPFSVSSREVKSLLSETMCDDDPESRIKRFE
jgi:hypothetical protein